MVIEDAFQSTIPVRLKPKSTDNPVDEEPAVSILRRSEPPLWRDAPRDGPVRS